MSPTCPEGHQSEATDYCDICGTPMGGPAGSPAASTPGPTLPPPAEGSALDLTPPPAPAQTCPHCGSVNVADALFCESCGYDFTTGAAPLGSLDLAGPAEAEKAGDEPTAEETADEEPTAEEAAGHQPVLAEPADDEATADEPIVDEPVEQEPPGPEPAEDTTPEDGPPPAPDADAAPASRPADAVPAHARPRHTPPSRALSDVWVVEVWVDPDWYAVQQTEEACPSPGLPDVVLVRRNVVLIGRPSGSLGVRPDVDSGADSAVSRRHAQLTSDGTRWWIEDLGSSNGTYVGSVGEPLPTEPIRGRVEIDRDDRIYIGAWTRLVVRQATASEQAGQG